MKKTAKSAFARITKTYIGLMDGTEKIKPNSTAEWLTDNYYILKQAYAERVTSPRGKLRTDGKTPYILSWSVAFLSANSYKLTSELLSAALTAEQENAPFSAAELRLLPAALRTALLQYAAVLCETPHREGLLGNVIKSVVALRDIDCKVLFEEQCAIDRIFAADKTYPRMTDETKNLYRAAVSHLANAHSLRESDVATQAMAMAKAGRGRQAHVGYYLIDAGENALRRALSLPLRRNVSKTRWYLISIGILTLGGAVGVFFAGGRWLSVLSLVTLSDITVTLVGYLLLRATHPRRLPALELTDGIPEPILVVFPTLLSSPEKAKEMSEKLEICYLANRDEQLRFALLGDFKDSAEQCEPQEIIAAATAAIDALNEKYGARFFLLHRAQTYSPMQQKWMGYERKRGALLHLNAFLRGDYSFRYTAGTIERLAGVRYVITLDDDTFLPIDGARHLAGVALHPLNRPVIRDGIVREGYGIIAPRVSVRLEDADKTLFSRVFAGPGGIDTYSCVVSELYMDVFGEAIFTGKGIYAVDTFAACMSVPPDTVLSHDLLEGSYVRTGLSSDIQVFDGFPHRYTAYVQRLHRWVRGDWQIAAWLGKKVHNASDKVVPNPISALSKWKIFDNLRRSVTPAGQLILLLCGNSVLALTAVLSLLLPTLLYLLDALLQKRFVLIGEKNNSNVLYGIRSLLYRMTLSVTFLANTAYLSLDAAIRGLWRGHHHRKTLEWVTAADAEKSGAANMRGYYRAMLPSVILGILLAFSVLRADFYEAGLYVFFAVLWLAAPGIAYETGRIVPPDDYGLSPKRVALLRETATRIWKFFNDYTNEETHFLPPDNVQLKPYKGVAHRTSPTNIGLSLVAALCAADLGLIDAATLRTRTEQTVATLERLEKWRGHLYNWYDTKTLAPLSPRYVSTVDSGNLVCYLLVAARGILEYDETADALARRMVRLAEQTDFRPLYDAHKKLFSIGFSVEEDRLTNAYYDLLASEARQAGFIAIALGQIPPAHWFSLGRALTAADGYRGLLSWSGTMFEYFMPLLIMKNYKNTLLDETYKFAVACQKRCGRRRRIPWGVSESGFYAFDTNGCYQYKAFGVPELGLKRDLAEDAVIAPYATLLALMTDPKSALYNMSVLKREGLYGEYGYFEAADYTPARMKGTMRRGIVKSYMAHHQGMSLAAITNLLCQNVLQKRFHSYPAVRAAEPLLKERVPLHATISKERHVHVSPIKLKWQAGASCVRTYSGPLTDPLPVCLLTNGSYHLQIDRCGQGFGAVDGVRLQKAPPATSHLWLRNSNTGNIWDAYGETCVFSGHTATYYSGENNLEATLTVCVCPDDDCESRRLTVLNKSGGRRVIDAVYYFAPSLTTHAAETAHNAFSNLFVVTEEQDGVLYATRRRRDRDEKTAVGFACARTDGIVRFETDRVAFWGRCRTLPHVLTTGGILQGKTGTVTDPCFALQVRLTIEQGESASVTFFAGLAETREKAAAMAEKYRHGNGNIEAEAYAYAMQNAPGVLREGEELRILHALAYMVYGNNPCPQSAEARSANRAPKTGLWKIGISGDRPLLTLRIGSVEDEGILDEVTAAHGYWAAKGFACDLAVICDEPGGYTTPVYEMAEKRRSGNIYVFGKTDLDTTDRLLLIAASRVYLDSTNGGLAGLAPYPLQELSPCVPRAWGECELPLPPLLFDNGYGGFDAADGSYHIRQEACGTLPMPWCHVLANAQFGTLLGDGGSGYTWSGNSREFRLTPWYNDAVSEPLGERLTVHEGTDAWSPMAGVFEEKGYYYTKYAFGYAVYTRATRDILHKATVFVPPTGEKKIVQCYVENRGNTERRLTIRYEITPVLGVAPMPGEVLVTADKTGTLTMRNPMTDSEKVVYLTVQDGGTARGTHVCRTVELAPHTAQTVVFVLGTDTPEYVNAEGALAETKAYWQDICTSLTVETNDRATALLCNGWLLYQTLCCRIFARTAFYQSGGAFGFRDQLQDALALLYVRPDFARRQLLLHAAHQFTEGDVFHWWHADGRGVRTRFSDDRLWLVYVACAYMDVTGDSSILDETAPFIEEPVLLPHEQERYTHIKGTTAPLPLYEHLTRAVEISLSKGRHGLPLMGGGDWNDGMNRIGSGGEGESMWLCWFLKAVLDRFAPICESRGDSARAARYHREALLLTEAADAEGWDGTRYVRAFFDNGAVLGSGDCTECAIDGITQAWAVIAGGGAKTRAKAAMQTVYDLLVDREHGIARLLAPPFAKSKNDPGYIQSYPCGIRENGGQYTHGAIWYALAFARLGNCKRAWELYQMLNPINHALTRQQAAIYKTEPYVMSADIYTADGQMGRGGWSWYTGASAWMYTVGIGTMFGFRKNGDTVSFAPCIPHLPFTLRYRYFDTHYVFHVHGDGGPYRLVNDGKVHTVEVP